MRLLSILLLFITSMAYGQQVFPPMGNATSATHAGGLFYSDIQMKLPGVKRCLPYFDSTNSVAVVGGTLYVHNGTTWVAVQGGGGGNADSAVFATQFRLDSVKRNLYLSKQDKITLTTNGTSGAATFNGVTLNVPQYAGQTYSPGLFLTLNGNTFNVDTTNLYSSVLGTLAAGTGIAYNGRTISNTAPDQTVTIAAGTGASVTGTYPSYTVTNTAPDQTVNISAGAGVSVGGAYPSYTVTNTAPNQTVNISAGTGISIGGTYPSYSVTNTSPDRTVSISAAGSATVTGTYPNFTINTPASNAGTVTNVSVASANGFAGSVSNATTTPAITLTTTVNGLVKGNGTNLQPAVAGTDYLTGTGVTPGTYGDANNIPAVTITANGLIGGISTVSRPVQSFRTACRVATTASLTATYNNGTSGVGATLTNSGTQAALAIDGVTLSVGDRVAYWTASVSNQFQQGVYSVTATGSGSTNWVLTRTPEFDGSAAGPIALGAIVDIAQGTSNQGILLMVNATGPFTVGTTPITFIANGANASTLAGVVPPTSGGTGLGIMANQQIYSGGSGTSMVQDPMLQWDNANKVAIIDATGAGDFVPSSPVAPPDKLKLTNGTAATNSAQKCSGAIDFQGNGFKSTAPSASKTVSYRAFCAPVQGTSNPTARLYFIPYVNDTIATPTAETYLDGRGNAYFNKVYVGQPPAALNTSNTSVCVGTTPPPLLTGSGNTIDGQGCMTNATTSSGNVVVGDQAGTSLVGNGNCTILGSRGGTGTTGGSNILITSAGAIATITSGTGNIALGNYAIAAGLRTLSSQVLISDGSGNLRMYIPSTGNLILGGSTTDNGSALQVNGSVSATNTVLSATQTTVSGSTSGSAIFSEPAQGSSYKKVVIYCSALVGTATYTFPASFTNTPMVMSSNGPATTVVTSLSTSTCTVTGATTTGFLIIEGY